MIRRIGIIGNGKMAMDCIKHVLNFEVKIVFVIFDLEKDNSNNSILNFCNKNNLNAFATDNLNSAGIIQQVIELAPELIFNINSYKIIKHKLLSIPPKGIINFHNGPLPAYGGVNIPFWAILNAEKEHGVTWHYIDNEIDTGDIVVQSFFEIKEDETAASLMIKSILHGVTLFKSIFELIISETNERKPQKGTRSYYSLKQFLENKGIIDFSKTFEQIHRLVRGLYYNPFVNNFLFAKLNNSELVVNEISLKEMKNNEENHGKIIKLNAEEFIVSCADSIISIDSIMTTSMEEIDFEDLISKFGFKENDYL